MSNGFGYPIDPARLQQAYRNAGRGLQQAGMRGMDGLPLQQNPYQPLPQTGPVPAGRPNVQTVQTTTPAVTQPQGTGTGSNYFPPRPTHNLDGQSLMSAFSGPDDGMSDIVRQRRDDLRAFERGDQLRPGAQFNNPSLAQALMRSKQIGQNR